MSKILANLVSLGKLRFKYFDKKVARTNLTTVCCFLSVANLQILEHCCNVFGHTLHGLDKIRNWLSEVPGAAFSVLGIVDFDKFEVAASIWVISWRSLSSSSLYYLYKPSVSNIIKQKCKGRIWWWWHRVVVVLGAQTQRLRTSSWQCCENNSEHGTVTEKTDIAKTVMCIMRRLSFASWVAIFKNKYSLNINSKLSNPNHKCNQTNLS